MSFVTSKNFRLPDDADEFSSRVWYNLWTKKYWPYDELEQGESLYWYESASKCIVWRSRVSEVLRFPYQAKDEVHQKLKLTPVDVVQDYFVDGPDAGYCLSYRVRATERLSIMRPDDFKFPQLGWPKVSPEVEAAWPQIPTDR